MSLWRRERLGIGIGAHAVCGTAPAVTQSFDSPLMLSASMTEADRSRQLTEVLAALFTEASKTFTRRLEVRVAIADGLARYWMMRPPAVGSLGELRAVAHARCQQLFGSAQRWRVAGDWSARRPFLCAAVPEWVAEGVRNAFGAGAQMNAALLEVLARHPLMLPKDGWACVTFPGRTSLLSMVHGQLGSVRSMPSDAGVETTLLLAQAAQELSRESLRTQVALDTPVHWCHIGGAPAAAPASASIEVSGLQFSPVRLTGPQMGPAGTDTSSADAECAAWLAALV